MKRTAKAANLYTMCNKLINTNHYMDTFTKFGKDGLALVLNKNHSPVIANLISSIIVSKTTA
jgi:hypothetical protein